MLECSPPVIVTIIDQGAVYFRRGNLPGRAPPLSTVEKDCWQAVHHDAQARRSRDGPLAVQGWPIHEAEWKREILRAEVAEWEA